MADFEFIQNPVSRKWVVLAPRRAKRPDIAKGRRSPSGGSEPVCPFCVGHESLPEEVYRVAEGVSGWSIRVLKNKYPFAPIHEVIIHSPDHHKNFDELALSQVELILQTYKHRYNEHAHKGQVYIFHNRGEGGGESLPHPHSQLAVVPFEIEMDIPTFGAGESPSVISTPHFLLSCPQTSQWPDEVWIAPKNRGRSFGEITDDEIADLAKTLALTIQILDMRYAVGPAGGRSEFPFNFYIYPGGDWYMRLIPRVKGLGGFEIGTGVYVNTQDPKETMEFIKEHFEKLDVEKLKQQHQADYQTKI